MKFRAALLLAAFFVASAALLNPVQAASAAGRGTAQAPKIILLIAVSNSSAGTTTPAPGAEEYTPGAIVQVYATGYGGYGLGHWTLDGSNVGGVNPYVVVMNMNHTLIAVFAKGLVQVSVTSDPAGYGLVQVDGQAVTTPAVYSWPAGAQHLLSAVEPTVGETRYVFVAWTDGGAQTHMLAVPQSPLRVTAAFSTQYALTMQGPAGSGSTDPSSPGVYWYAANTQLIIRAYSSGSAVFDHWELDGQTTAPGSPDLALAMNSPHSLRAAFASSGTYPAYVSSDPPGLSPQPSCSPDCPQTPPYAELISGTTLVVTAPQATGWTFTNFTITRADGGEVNVTIRGNQAVILVPPSALLVRVGYKFIGKEPTVASGGLAVPAASSAPVLLAAAGLLMAGILRAKRQKRAR